MQIIYTDGSARGNPGPGGWGGIIALEDKVKELGGREEHTTNNRMELLACIKSLEQISNTSAPVTLYTDSEYVKKGITEWIFNWQKNGWRTAAKKAVLNADLWQELLKAVEGKDIEWKLVRGHADTPGNNRCDEIATTCADNLPLDLYDGDRANYKIKI